MSEEVLLPHHHVDQQKEQSIIENLPTQEDIASTAALLKQVSDPTRLKIFLILYATEECLIDIAALVHMSSPAVAHHLKLLKMSGLLVTRRQGKEVFYTAADTEKVHTLYRALSLLVK